MTIPEKQVRTLKYRVYPTKAQARVLNNMLSLCCDLYNCALEHRMLSYQKYGRSLSGYDQCNELKIVRAENEDYAALPYATIQEVILRLDLSYRAFFRRGGFPKFRRKADYNTLGVVRQKGFNFTKDGQHFTIKGCTSPIKIRVDKRPIPANLKQCVSCKITRELGEWYLQVPTEIAIPSELPRNKSIVGIDLGLKWLIATSDGETIAAPRIFRAAERLLRIRNRALARCKRGSNRRKQAKLLLAKTHRRIARVRKDFIHNLSHQLTERYHTIFFEKLNVKGMVKGRLSKSINDAAWTMLTSQCEYKAAAKNGRVIYVNPAYTSQTCPECGNVEKKTLSQRTHSCKVCGCEMDRDVAAAKIILQRGIDVLIEGG